MWKDDQFCKLQRETKLRRRRAVEHVEADLPIAIGALQCEQLPRDGIDRGARRSHREGPRCMAADNSHISVGNAIIDMEFSGVVEDREPVRVGCLTSAMPTAIPLV